VINVIKMVTAHPRIIAVVAVSTATIAGGSIMGVSPGDIASQTGNGLSSLYKYLKAAGFIGAFLAFMFILFRFNIIGWKMAPENSSFMVARRGLIVRDKHRDVVLHDSGRNRLHIINYRHLVPVHFGDRFAELGRHEFALHGITWKADFSLRWRIPKDKKLLERTVTSVSDRNWWDGEFNQLTRAIGEVASGQLAGILKHAWIDEAGGTPVVDQSLAGRLIGNAINPYGGKSFELIITPVTRTDAQQGKDGNLAIADAIASVSTSRLSLLRRLLKGTT